MAGRLAYQKQQLLAALRSYVAVESDRMADSARGLAGDLVLAPKVGKAQVRNVENLAYSTDKVSDVMDLLKTLIGRDSTGERWAHKSVGKTLLDALTGLRGNADRIADRLREYGDAWDDDLARRIHLQLCREYLRHLSASFEYYKPGVADGGSGDSDG